MFETSSVVRVGEHLVNLRDRLSDGLPPILGGSQYDGVPCLARSSSSY
jgi:hypothetical protein